MHSYIPNPSDLILYSEELPADVPYRVPVAHSFTEEERAELEDVLDVSISPYRDPAGYAREIASLVQRGAIPAFLRELCEAMKLRDTRDDPIVYFQNCPTGQVPILDFDDPRLSKYERKMDFIAEAFLSVFAELHGTPIVTYRTANEGDLFHDVHPLRELKYSWSQKSLHTLPFHTDLPDNKVRPDWVNLLYLRNSERNEVYTAFVRLQDVVHALDREVLATLREPLFRAPYTRVENNISVYGQPENGFMGHKPVIIRERGYDWFCFNEVYTTSESSEGLAAISALSSMLQRIRHSLFLRERDFVAICNNTSMHARHVVRIDDLEAHHHRWVLKTWNVADLEPHRQHFLPGRINTADE
jgi:L-asparagine oxygenase